VAVELRAGLRRQRRDRGRDRALSSR
jgi:hypothetical protein